MLKIEHLVTPLRVLLAVFLAGLLFAQTFMNYGQFINVGPNNGTPLGARIMLMSFVAIEILCVQIVVICVWQLLGLVKADTIFSPRAFKWVNRILSAIATACGLLFALLVFMYFTFDDPGMPMAFGIILLAGCVMWMLVAVLRALLVQATTLRDELEAVI